MAGSVNKVILIGNLGKDPEIRTTNGGDRVASLRIATSESWKDKSSGERKEKTEWHSVQVWNEHLVKACESYIKKGSTVYIEGSLQTRKYEQNGVEKYATEIILSRFKGELTIISGGKRDDDAQGGTAGGSAGYGAVRSSGSRESFAVDLDDEIPFATCWSIR